MGGQRKADIMKDFSLKEPIARGRTADVYNWDEEYILKLFHDWFELEDIEYELRIARATSASGVKSPMVVKQVQVQGRNGLVYERVEGVSMLGMFQLQPWKVAHYGKLLAMLHTEMHERTAEVDIPGQQASLERKIRRAEALPLLVRTSLLNSLASMPSGDRVCHGDFHPANVLMEGKEATVIDWIDASRGNPLADVARTSIITLGAVSSSQVPNPVLKIFVKVFHSAYLEQYFHLRPGGEDEYRRWLPILAGARLSENIPELERWLVKQAERIQ